MRTIVLAWLVEDFRAVGESRVDLGERPKLEKFDSPRAAIWLNEGTPKDLKKARAFARKESDYKIHVFVYPPTDPDPIERAKRDVLGTKGKALCPNCGKTGSTRALNKHLESCGGMI